MQKYTEYHKTLINRALKKTLLDLGYSNPINTIRALSGWALGAYIIYQWDSNMFFEETPFWLAALASVGALVIITFIYEWSRQGCLLFNEIENDKSILDKNLNKIKQQEDIIIGACDLYKKGRSIYNAGFSDKETYNEWDRKMMEWSNEAKTHFLDKTNSSLVHSLDNTYQSTWYDFGIKFDEYDGSQKKAEKYSGMLMVVDDFIKENSTKWRNDLSY